MEKSKKKIIEMIERAPIVRRPRGNPGALHNLYYKDVICAFDIETTIDEETNQAFIYSWAFCCNSEEGYVSGRTWEEWREFTEELLKVTKGAAIPCYVHFLPFEFQFLAGVNEFTEVLCGKKREVIKAYSEPYEFRCSYKLTGLSLDAFTREMGVDHKKLSGSAFNYDKVRYPWTKLTKKEKEYIKNDVVGLVEAIRAQMSIYNDTIYTIPITQTGYVRREIKRRMRTYPWDRVEEQKINFTMYKRLNIAMRGGNSHANRYITGEIIPDVECWDISSAYPAAIVYGEFPMGAWFTDPNPNMEQLLKLIYMRNKAVVATIRFKNIRTKNKYEPFPYIPDNPVKTLIGEGTNLRVDNGRIISAAGYITGVYTDLDLKIIFDQYDFDTIEVLEMSSTKKRPLPNQIREYVIELYRDKTKIKNVNNTKYNAIKREINGLFGMFSEDPGKVYNIYVDGKFIKEDITKEEAVNRKIKKSSLSYAWGVYTTAIVRYWIQGILNKLGEAAYYVDTDGIKCAKGYKYVFDDFNAVIEDLGAQIGGVSVPDSDGVIHTLGAFEYEGFYDRFITLGSKKYAYEKNNKVYITTAGVNKEKGGIELGALENYREGFTFQEAAGREAYYNDDINTTIEREGHSLPITRNVALKKSTYKLGLTEEYKRLIGYTEILLRFERSREDG